MDVFECFDLDTKAAFYGQWLFEDERKDCWLEREKACSCGGALPTFAFTKDYITGRLFKCWLMSWQSQHSSQSMALPCTLTAEVKDFHVLCSQNGKRRLFVLSFLITTDSTEEPWYSSEVS